MAVNPRGAFQPNDGRKDALNDICDRALRRFTRAYPIPVAIERLDGKADSVWASGSEIPNIHPTCQECMQTGSCDGRWSQFDSTSSEVQTGCCSAGHLIASIPVARNGNGVSAVCRLVEPARIPRASFLHRVEVLAKFISEAAGTEVESIKTQKLASSLGPWWHPSKNGVHPQVQRALGYIEEHLTDPRTNVATVARALGINSTYLSHIFSEQMNTRMSRYIASRRIQLAKNLLATTDWQIKRVAFESGHSNADWFSQVFHTHAGMTPCDYRRQLKTSQPT